MVPSVITQELLKCLFVYENGHLFWRIKPSNSASIGDLAGYIRPPQNYRYVGINKKYYLAHRLIYLYHYGQLPKYIDHIDGNVYNNKIENLRECSLRQNGMNRGKGINNTSGHKGISWYSSNNRWCAKLSTNDGVKRKFFSLREDAINWIKEMRNTHHNEFANNN